MAGEKERKEAAEGGAEKEEGCCSGGSCGCGGSCSCGGGCGKGRRGCGGLKFVLGFLIGLLLAGIGFGLFETGKCIGAARAGCGMHAMGMKSCPYSGPAPAAPEK